jgi:hypothetical protein
MPAHISAGKSGGVKSVVAFKIRPRLSQILMRRDVWAGTAGLPLDDDREITSSRQ